MMRLFLLFILLSACAPVQFPDSQPSAAPTIMDPTLVATAVLTQAVHTQANTPPPEEPEVAGPTLTQDTPVSLPSSLPATSQPTLGPQDWQALPVIPPVSDHVIEIYLNGLAAGNNPQAFSKIGDCESTPTWFLGDFDLDSQHYRLGPYQSLESVIANFHGSFGRTSLAARRGFKASSALTPLWADRTQCEKNETPLACEYRLHRPILAFIMLGTNDVYHQDTFDSQMRQIIEYTIGQGIIPVLATKADNLEGDGSINATIAQLAWEYNIPLWNFWLAVQSLPGQGLQPDGSHLTWAQNLFDVPQVLENAWPVRNLTALQVLDAIWQVVKDLSIP